MSISFNITARPQESHGAVLDPQMLSCSESPLILSRMSIAELPAWTMSPQNWHVINRSGQIDVWCRTCQKHIGHLSVNYSGRSLLRSIVKGWLHELRESSGKWFMRKRTKINCLPSLLSRGQLRKNISVVRGTPFRASPSHFFEELVHIYHNAHGSLPLRP